MSWLRTKRLKGFTLVEVLVSMGIIAIMGSLVVPNYVSTQRKTRDDNAIHKAMTLESAMVAYLQDKGAQGKANWAAAPDDATRYQRYLTPYLNNPEATLGADGTKAGTYVPEGYNYQFPDITGGLGNIIVTVRRNLDNGLLRGVAQGGGDNSSGSGSGGSSSGPLTQTYNLIIRTTLSGQLTTNYVGDVHGGGRYNAGINAAIVASPQTGYSFNGWSGDIGIINASATNTQVMMDSDKTIYADFINSPVTPTNYNLNIQIVRNGGQPVPNPDTVGTVTGGGSHEAGQYAAVTATAVDNPAIPGLEYIFHGWINPDGSTANILNPSSSSAQVLMNQDNKTIYANFLAVYSLVLDVAVDGVNPLFLNPPVTPSDVGTVSAPLLQPPTVGGYYENIIEGSAPISIIAMPMEGYTFVEWQTPGLGIADTHHSSTTVNMLGLAGGDAKIVVASFTMNTYTLAFQVTLNGQPVPSGTNAGAATSSDAQFPSYPYGSTANITATPAEGYVFNGWKNSDGTTTGITDPTAATTTVVMNAGKTLVADFMEVPSGSYNLTYQITLNGSSTFPDSMTLEPLPVDWGIPGLQLVLYNETYPEGFIVGEVYSFNEGKAELIYPSGATAYINASWGDGYAFNGWKNLDGTTTGIPDPFSDATSVVMDANRTLVADFIEAEVQHLVLARVWQDNSGGGGAQLSRPSSDAKLAYAARSTEGLTCTSVRLVKVQSYVGGWTVSPEESYVTPSDTLEITAEGSGSSKVIKRIEVKGCWDGNSNPQCVSNQTVSSDQRQGVVDLSNVAEDIRVDFYVGQPPPATGNLEVVVYPSDDGYVIDPPSVPSSVPAGWNQIGVMANFGDAQGDATFVRWIEASIVGDTVVDYYNHIISLAELDTMITNNDFTINGEPFGGDVLARFRANDGYDNWIPGIDTKPQGSQVLVNADETVHLIACFNYFSNKPTIVHVDIKPHGCGLKAYPLDTTNNGITTTETAETGDYVFEIDMATYGATMADPYIISNVSYGLYCILAKENDTSYSSYFGGLPIYLWQGSSLDAVQAVKAFAPMQLVYDPTSLAWQTLWSSGFSTGDEYLPMFVESVSETGKEFATWKIIGAYYEWDNGAWWPDVSFIDPVIEGSYYPGAGRDGVVYNSGYDSIVPTCESTKENWVTIRNKYIPPVHAVYSTNAVTVTPTYAYTNITTGPKAGYTMTLGRGTDRLTNQIGVNLLQYDTSARSSSWGDSYNPGVYECWISSFDPWNNALPSSVLKANTVSDDYTITGWTVTGTTNWMDTEKDTTLYGWETAPDPDPNSPLPVSSSTVILTPQWREFDSPSAPPDPSFITASVGYDTTITLDATILLDGVVTNSSIGTVQAYLTNSTDSTYYDLPKHFRKNKIVGIEAFASSTNYQFANWLVDPDIIDTNSVRTTVQLGTTNKMVYANFTTYVVPPIPPPPLDQIPLPDVKIVEWYVDDMGYTLYRNYDSISSNGYTSGYQYNPPTGPRYYYYSALTLPVQAAVVRWVEYTGDQWWQHHRLEVFVLPLLGPVNSSMLGGVMRWNFDLGEFFPFGSYYFDLDDTAAYAQWKQGKLGIPPELAVGGMSQEPWGWFQVIEVGPPEGPPLLPTGEPNPNFYSTPNYRIRYDIWMWYNTFIPEVNYMWRWSINAMLTPYYLDPNGGFIGTIETPVWPEKNIYWQSCIVPPWSWHQAMSDPPSNFCDGRPYSPAYGSYCPLPTQIENWPDGAFKGVSRY